MNKKSKLLRRSAAALVLAATSATMIAPASHAADLATWEKLALSVRQVVIGLSIPVMASMVAYSSRNSRGMV